MSFSIAPLTSAAATGVLSKGMSATTIATASPLDADLIADTPELALMVGLREMELKATASVQGLGAG